MNYEIKDFNKEVIEKSNTTPVLVDFWAEWCAPCRTLGPTLEKLAEKYKDKFSFAKVDTDANQEVAVKYGIKSIPTVKLFINGEVADEFSGALPEKMIEEWLDKALPSEEKELLKNARSLINTEPEKSKEILEKLNSLQPDNFEVKVVLAKLLLFENPAKSLQLIDGYENEISNTDEAESVYTIAVMFKKLVKSDQLPDADVKDIYISAIDDLQKMNFDGALEKFINVIREDRQYDGDGARKVCIAIFKYLGEEHPITQKHRRDFGSALYI
ncbi:MAG: thioredoxin [Ignavibacteriaceae bacterium]|nr:thioredoxin [Ignavibacteriaceae bacterium]